MKYRVKKRWIFLGLILTGFAAAVVLLNCFLAPDHSGYQGMVERVKSGDDQFYKASQNRKEVVKSMWSVKNGRHLEALLKCSEAAIDYEKEGSSHAIVENMQDVRSYMQEEIYYIGRHGQKALIEPEEDPDYAPLQKIRYMEAKSAKYHYHTGQLEAADVCMKVLILPGHRLPQTIENWVPEMECRAERAVFNGHHFEGVDLDGDIAINIAGKGTIKSEGASYKENLLRLFKNVEADFDRFGVLKSDKEILIVRSESGGMDSMICIGNCAFRGAKQGEMRDIELTASGSAVIDHKNRTIYLHSEKDQGGKVEDDKQIYLRNHLMKIYANEGLIRYDLEEGRFHLTSVNVDGGVRLVNRDGAIMQYALAERAVYEPESQEMHFFSAEKGKVLFFDKINNLQVSATEVLMQKDVTAGKPRFRGIGDVRFHFAEEEYNRLKSKFLLEKGDAR